MAHCVLPLVSSSALGSTLNESNYIRTKETVVKVPCYETPPNAVSQNLTRQVD